MPRAQGSGWTRYEDLAPRYQTELIQNNEPGTVIYAVHRVKDAPLSRIFYELYESREAFDVHEQQEHTKRFLDKREQ